MPYPDLAPSSYVHSAAHGWPQVWNEYTASSHPSDRWAPDDWSKPLSMKDVHLLRAFAAQGAVGVAKYIAIPSADQMSREVANALLKLLEEPPRGVYVVLFGETDRMIDTVRSRVRYVPLDLEARAPETAAQRVRSFYDAIDPEHHVATAERMLYLAPLLHSTVQTDTVLEDLTHD